MAETNTSSSKLIGIGLASFTGAMWGLQGVLGEVLFEAYPATPEWVVSNRLFVSAVLILLYCLFKGFDLFSILKSWKNIFDLIVLGIVGYIGLQYLFFVTVELAGASLATILQFTAPAFVYLWLLLRGKKRPNVAELSLVVLVFVGVVLIVTQGDLTSVAITPLGILAGLGSGIGLAVTSIQPRQLMSKYPSPVVTGWAMLFGGIPFQFINPFWQAGFQRDAITITFMFIIVFFGTVLAFLAYSAATKYIDSTLASILTVFEPLVATFLSVLFLGQVLTVVEIIGIILVIGAVTVLSAKTGSNSDNEPQIKQSSIRRKTK